MPLQVHSVRGVPRGRLVGPFTREKKKTIHFLCGPDLVFFFAVTRDEGVLGVVFWAFCDA
jgi:hypothetical protein